MAGGGLLNDHFFLSFSLGLRPSTSLGPVYCTDTKYSSKHGKDMESSWLFTIEFGLWKIVKAKDEIYLLGSGLSSKRGKSLLAVMIRCVLCLFVRACALCPILS